ncbi:MAG: 30S ribosomal protein S4 [Chloroflexi bacterium ADurb.Bin360]|nr:MAG: 30S ribosomal protein S4 [Chloroflexi bacterium ADurb.Bin360]
MGKYTGPKHKRSRRIGMDLYGNGGESLERRLQQPPGPHGKEQAFRRTESAYTQQLREKQKVKWMYGVREQQFRRILAEAQRMRGQTGLILLQLLERRLDNVIYRMGLALTRLQARQMVNHGHVLVNGRRLNIPSYLVRPGDIVSLKERARRLPQVQAVLAASSAAPQWLEPVGVTTARVLRSPFREEVHPDIKEQLIVEFYSR